MKLLLPSTPYTCSHFSSTEAPFTQFLPFSALFSGDMTYITLLSACWVWTPWGKVLHVREGLDVSGLPSPLAYYLSIGLLLCTSPCRSLRVTWVNQDKVKFAQTSRNHLCEGKCGGSQEAGFYISDWDYGRLNLTKANIYLNVKCLHRHFLC